MSSTIKAQDLVNWALPQIGNFPLDLANGQPALGFINNAVQMMTMPPLRWNWNRSSIDFITTSGTQDYRNAGSWASATPFPVGTVIIDSNNNGQKVIATTGGNSGGSAPAWATGVFATTNDNSGAITWQNIGPLVSIPQVTNFGWVELAQVQDVNNSNVWKEMKVSYTLSRSSQTGKPDSVSVNGDDNAGDITVRLMPCPGAAYPVGVNFQQKIAPVTSLAQNMPVPDHMWHIYSSLFLAQAFRYAEDPRAGMELQQGIARLLSYQQGLTDAEVAIFLRTYNTILFSGTGFAGRQAQGLQARQVGG